MTLWFDPAYETENDYDGLFGRSWLDKPSLSPFYRSPSERFPSLAPSFEPWSDARILELEDLRLPGLSSDCSLS